MGFIPGVVTEIEAFLTETGAQQIMNNGINQIKYFAISDDASNYNTNDKLIFNQVFTLGGKLSVDNKTLSVINDGVLRNMVYVDNVGGETFKTFENDSASVILEKDTGNLYTVNFYSTYSYNVDKTNPNYQLNWITDLSLPYGPIDTALWTTDFNYNGYANTSISNMITNNLLVFVVDGSRHAYIDGKSIKITLPYLNTTTDLYGTYLNLNANKSYYDVLNAETSNYISNRFGPNVVLLFSDLIQPPNGDATKSWSTGYNYGNAPFSQGNKILANYNTSPGRNKDTAVGIVYLDKGVVVIFDPVLYNGYVNRTNDNLTIYNKNVIKRTVVNFVCDLPIGKFYRSKNPTFTLNSPVRITSIGLFNTEKQLVAVGRLNSEVEKNSAQRFTFLVKLII
jgi:hypothetical protein